MLWAVGRYDLRLSEEDFWGLVPRQFLALVERLKDARTRLEFGPALIVTAIQAFAGSKKNLDPTKFMPSHEKKETPVEEQMARMKTAMIAAGGRP